MKKRHILSFYAEIFSAPAIFQNQMYQPAIIDTIGLNDLSKSLMTSTKGKQQSTTLGTFSVETSDPDEMGFVADQGKQMMSNSSIGNRTMYTESKENSDPDEFLYSNQYLEYTLPSSSCYACLPISCDSN